MRVWGTFSAVNRPMKVERRTPRPPATPDEGVRGGMQECSFAFPIRISTIATPPATRLPKYSSHRAGVTFDRGCSCGIGDANL